jgi:hypothetical protein
MTWYLTQHSPSPHPPIPFSFLLSPYSQSSALIYDNEKGGFRFVDGEAVKHKNPINERILSTSVIKYGILHTGFNTTSRQFYY